MGSLLKLELNLQQLSLIRVAINIWEDESIKKKLTDYVILEFNKTPYHYVDFNDKSKEWIKQQLEEIKYMNIPYSMVNELLYVTKAIGNRLFSWLKRISKVSQSTYSYPSIKNYIKHIYWTNIGTIDEVKIFKKIYNGIPTNKKNTNMSFLFDEACNYCLEEYIVCLWNDLSYVKVKSVEKIFKNEQRFITDYWLSYLLNGKTDASIRWEKTGEFRKYIKNFVSTSASDVEGNIAMKYFYDKISQIEKKNSLTKLNARHLSINVLWSECEWKSTGAIDCLVFLIQRMPESMLLIFLEEHKNKVLSYFLKSWPWRYLFLGMLDLSWRFFTHDDYRKLFNNIIATVLEENDIDGTHQCTSLWLISEAWRKTPDCLRESIVNMCWTSNKPLIDKLQEITLIVSAINNDFGINLLRDELIKGFEDSCPILVRDNKIELLNIFLDKILTTDEERNFFKNKLDTKKICKNFIMEFQYVAAENFLNFRFNCENDKIIFKKNWKIDDCGRTIYNIWYKNSKDMNLQLQMFFEWLDFTKSEMIVLKDELIYQRDKVIFKEHSLRNCPFFYIEALCACEQFIKNKE